MTSKGSGRDSSMRLPVNGEEVGMADVDIAADFRGMNGASRSFDMPCVNIYADGVCDCREGLKRGGQKVAIAASRLNNGRRRYTLFREQQAYFARKLWRRLKVAELPLLSALCRHSNAYLTL